MEAIDGMAHKLVQPARDTRWLSHEASISTLLHHYSSICLALESIYVDAGDIASDAGGLLLTLRKTSTLQILVLLQYFLQPLARLSKTLQSSGSNIASAMTIAKATIAALRDDFSIQQIESRAADLKANATSAGVRMEEGLNRTELTATCQRYFQAVIKNMEQRFSDQVSKLCQVQMFLSLKPDNPNLSDIAEILDVPLDDLETEWRILRRKPGDLASQESLIDLAVSSEKSAMFPAFACAIRRLLLLPILALLRSRDHSQL
jgi:hypothetical protein